MRFTDFIRLLAAHRFRVHPLRVPMACIVSGFTVYNSTMSLLQSALHGKRIRDVEIKDPPIFIVGHWRSGTTFLHELFFQDERFTSPTTYECFAPDHFLVTGRVIPKLAWFLLPSRRPMDNMPVGFDLPQEDEFALCSMGAPTPMYRSAFPNDPPPYLETLDMEDIAAETLSLWRASVRRFIGTLTVARGQRLVLKSPPHTGRIGHLAEMFSGATFVHIARNPIRLFQSTRRLWMTLDNVQGFQFPKHRDLDEFVFEAFERMYRGFEKQRTSIDEKNICQLRYEDLVAAPIPSMERIYDQLQLGEFERLRPRLEKFVAGRGDYRPNRHAGISVEIIEKIRTRWAGYIERYGYEAEIEEALNEAPE
jgi:hypothetical protein